MKSDNIRVGIFDSGIGGLTVLAECLKRAPNAEYLYYGDNLNAPYGNRAAEEIVALVRRALTLFERKGVQAAVLACNTATAVCAEQMRREFSFPVIGMEPAVKPASEKCANALVLATPRTAESTRLSVLINACPQCRFTIFPAAGLAGAIELQITRGKRLTLSDHLPAGEFDGIVLGCTHYIWLRREISRFYGNLPVFDGNYGAVNRLKDLIGGIGVGTADHTQPSYKLSENNMNKVLFVGSGAKINEKIYKSEQMFQ